MKRPLLLVGLLYVGGIIAAEYLAFSPRWLLAILGSFVVIALCWAQARPLLLYPIIFLAGSANLSLQRAVLSPIDLRNLLAQEPQIVTVRGVLLETPVVRQYETDERISWRTHGKLEVSELRPNKGDWHPAKGNLVISSAGELTNLFAGQIVEVTGRIEPPPPAVAEGLFDYRAYLARLNMYFQLSADSEKDLVRLASPH